MKIKICKNIKKRRLELGYSAKTMVNLVNPLRVKREAKEIAVSTYYKKENGEIPIYVEELEDFATVLATSPDFFYN